jgi:hypothetical protein
MNSIGNSALKASSWDEDSAKQLLKLPLVCLVELATKIEGIVPADNAKGNDSILVDKC